MTLANSDLANCQWRVTRDLKPPVPQPRSVATSLVAIVLALIWASAVSAQVVEEAPPQVDFDVEVQLQSFDMVWQTIKETHWDPAKVGAEWDAARDELRPRVEQAESIDQVREAMQELLERLGQSHFGIIPADSYDLIDAQGGDGTAGITVRHSVDGILVAGVDSGSPAELAGVQPGWAIARIRERTADEIVERIEKSAHGPVRFDTLIGLTGDRLASGAPGTPLPLSLIDFDNDSRELEIPLEKPTGRVAKLGHLPPILVRHRTRSFDDGIGYFWFNAFLDPVTIMPAFRKCVQDPQHARGLVIDLRGNMGGIAGMTMGMASMFARESKPLGVMSMRGTEIRFQLVARPKFYSGPVAILVDECSISSAEIFAGGMQDLGLGRVFGRRTAGLALPSVVTKLPNGDGFQYAMADYHSASGRTLEGNGVIPDVEIELSKSLLQQDPDPVLSAALEWLRSPAAHESEGDSRSSQSSENSSSILDQNTEPEIPGEEIP